MIEGLKVDIPSAELAQHLRDRVAHHRQKAKSYAAQATEVEKLKDSPGSYQTNDPVATLRGSAQTHTGRAELFQMILDHLVPDETYRLADHDLTRLELIAQHL